MASSLLDVCRFNPTAGGTTDWSFSSAVTGYQSPVAAGAVNAAIYSYRAESNDLSQWEVGFGTYNSGTGVIARTTVLFNSLGTTAKVNFSTTPQVAIVALAEDLAATGVANTFTQKQTAPAFAPNASLASAWGIDFQGVTVTIAAGGNSALLVGAGIVFLTDGSLTGNTGLYLTGGSAAALIGQSGGTAFVAPTTTPAAGKYCVAYDGSATYRIYNGAASAVTFYVGTLRGRPTL
jgi:hypothetical protein